MRQSQGPSETILLPKILGDEVSSLCVLLLKRCEEEEAGEEDEEGLKGSTFSVVWVHKDPLQMSSRNQERFAQIFPRGDDAHIALGAWLRHPEVASEAKSFMLTCDMAMESHTTNPGATGDWPH